MKCMRCASALIRHLYACILHFAHTHRSSTCESTDSLAELALTSPSAKARAQQLHAHLSANTSGNAASSSTTSATTATTSADADATAAGAAAANEQHNSSSSSSKLSLAASTSASDTPDVTASDVTEREGRVTSFGRVWPPPRCTTVTYVYLCTSYTHTS
jgi:hypothetical protein